MYRSVAFTIAIAISGMLLVIFAGAATAAARPVTALAPALISAVVPAAEPAQPGQGAPASEVQVTASQVDDLVRQREAAYGAQLDELTRRIQAGQEQVAVLASQEQALGNQLAQLEQTRQDRAASYQGQLDTLQAQYGQRFAQYAAQLQEIQSRLAQARALLGQ
jgi:chromosome segregation ATPase